MITPTLDDIENYAPPETYDSTRIDATNLSWDLDYLNDQVGPTGLRGKITKIMWLQILFVVYYALMVALVIGEPSNYYYPYVEKSLPTEEPTFQNDYSTNYTFYNFTNNNSSNTNDTTSYDDVTATGGDATDATAVTGSLELVLTDEESFVCNGTTYYMNNTGPLANETFVMDNSLFFVELSEMIGICIIAVVGIFLFTLTRLALGRYNQLLMIVKFRKTDNGEVVPIKFSVAFTIMCNLSKFASILYVNFCGHRALASETTTYGDNTTFWFIFTYLFCWALAMMWIMVWMLSCGICNGPKMIMWFRRAIFVATVVMFLLWFVNFDPEFNFDLDALDWFSMNLVSVVDVLLSLGMDLYLFCATRGDNDDDK